MAAEAGWHGDAIGQAMQRLFADARGWAEQAAADGWVEAAAARQVAKVEIGSPADLFDDTRTRPLVVGLFGGTGVGKSSLLNRLAGSAIARVGVRRPTSQEVTLYHHQERRPDRLPPSFPVERIRLAQHQDPARRDLVWLDMPDIDSTEQGNRELVLSWLPHIDLMLYVVSPERYRDDQGWQLFRRHAPDSAWLFVMNHWDQGVQEQLDDFRSLLVGEGFGAPLVFTTSCLAGAADQFEQLQGTVAGLLDQHRRGFLERMGIYARVHALEERLQLCARQLGNRRQGERLSALWPAIWRDTAEQIRAQLDWAIEERVARVARRKADKTAEPPAPIWTEWADERLQQAGRRLLLQARQQGLTTSGLAARLDATGGPEHPNIRLEQAASQALSRPGRAWQRGLAGLLGGLQLVLPTTALLWIGWLLLSRYYQGSTTGEGFLGLDFAVHSGLLLGASWLLPWLLQRLVQPSAPKALRQRLGRALQALLDEAAEQVDSQLRAQDNARLERLQQVLQLIERCRAFQPGRRNSDPMMARMLQQPLDA